MDSGNSISRLVDGCSPTCTDVDYRPHLLMTTSHKHPRDFAINPMRIEPLTGDPSPGSIYSHGDGDGNESSLAAFRPALGGHVSIIARLSTKLCALMIHLQCLPKGENNGLASFTGFSVKRIVHIP